MNSMLNTNPLLLLFLVAAIGYLVGTVKIKGASLGTAAVLFVGLFFGAIYPNANLPEIIFHIGLIFFVYSVGLSSGPAFFKSFQKNGYRDIGFILLMLTLSAIIAAAFYYLFGFNKSLISGLYSGSTTNTTAMAGVTDIITREGGSHAKQSIQDLVTGYTYSYPMGVFGVMIVLKLCEKFFKVNYEHEKLSLKKDYPVDEELSNIAIEVKNNKVFGLKLREVLKDQNWNIVFGRILKRGVVSIATWDTVLEEGDIIMVIGSAEDVDAMLKKVGILSDENILYNYQDYEIKRIFVSNVDVVGKELSSLNLSEKFDAVITRIRRGDTDMLAQSDTVLEIGDRIRFVAKKSDAKALSKFFGDSYYESSRVNVFSFGLGIALGLMIGAIEFSLPGGISFKLGNAGGPLVVGLIMGALQRTGPIVWTLPYSVNITLKQVGLTLLLAVVGVQSGHSFTKSLFTIEGLKIFSSGALLSMFTAFISIILGYKIFKIPFSMLLGFMSNQPAILDYASGLSKNKVPQIGYSIMFPISLILKILYAQILYLVL
jgi:putative transport protein